jgi:predicted Zn-dependent peptidase
MENGLRALAVERRAGPLVAIDVAIRAGAREERPDERGCAHFVEHMLFKGTETHPAGAADFAVESLGGILDASTSSDLVQITTTVPADNLKPALEAIADLVEHATLPAEEIERERGVILDELAADEGNPDRSLERAATATALADTPSGRAPGGSPEEIRAAARDAMLRFYRRCYRPERCTLAIAGDVKPQDALDAARAAFGGWKAGPAGADSLQPAPSGVQAAASAPQGISCARAGSRCVFAFRLPPGDEEGAVAAALLGDSARSGRLVRLAPLGARARLKSGVDGSVLLLSVRSAGIAKRLSGPGGAAAFLSSILGRILADPPTAQETAEARSRVLAGLDAEQERDAGLAHAIGTAAASGADLPGLYRKRLLAVTPAGVARPLKSLLQEDEASHKEESAQQKRDSARAAPPDAGPQELGESREARVVTLASGVRLALQSRPGEPFAAISVVVRTGAGDDPATAEMVAQALFLSSENRSFEDVQQAIGSVGGDLSVVREGDRVVISCVTVGRTLRSAIYTIAEGLKHADFSPEALARAWERIRAEASAESDPFQIAYRAAISRLNGAGAAPDALLRQVTPESAAGYFARRYLPGRISIGICGGFDEAQAQAALENDLGDLDRAPVRAGRGGISEPETPAAARIAIPGRSAVAMVAARAPDLTSPDYPAFRVLTALLGEGHACRLCRSLRERLGVGYSVGASWRQEADAPMVAYVVWDPARVSASGEPALTAKQALDAIGGEMDGLTASPATEEEMARARGLAAGETAIGRERAQDRAQWLALEGAYGLGSESDRALAERIRAVTAADVRRIAKSYFARRAALLAMPGGGAAR